MRYIKWSNEAEEHYIEGVNHENKLYDNHFARNLRDN